jgi:hypothetical protein
LIGERYAKGLGKTKKAIVNQLDAIPPIPYVD